MLEKREKAGYGKCSDCGKEKELFWVYNEDFQRFESVCEVCLIESQI